MVVMVVIVVMAVMVGMVVMFTFGSRKNVGSQKIESGLACLTSPWPGGDGPTARTTCESSA